jgi:hypothetical protein
MGRQFNDASLTVVAKSAHREAGSFERQMILAIDAIVTAKVLDRQIDAIDRSSPCAPNDLDPLFQADQGARQCRDDEALAIGIRFGVVGVLDPEDIARELDDRVLEAASGPDERHPALAGKSDRRQRALHAHVGTRGRDEEAGVRRQALFRSPLDNLDGRNPLKGKIDVDKCPVRRLMGLVRSVEVSHDSDAVARCVHSILSRQPGPSVATLSHATDPQLITPP